MANFVLVPGNWLGGWSWRAVASPLRAAGHEVHTPSLTGLGERVHLAMPEVDLSTHIGDLVNLLEFEDLRDVVLLGHSGANMPVTGAADRVPDRIARLVYLDTGPLPAGMAQEDFLPPELRERDERSVEEHGDGWLLPLPAWEELARRTSLDGLGEGERRQMASRAVPHPWRAAIQPQGEANPARQAIPTLGILNTFTVAQARELVASGAPAFQPMAGPQWEYVELPTSHWPMFSAPGPLAEILLQLAAGASFERWQA